MALLTLFRVVCYIALVGPLSGFMRTAPVDSDTFPSGCLGLPPWAWLLQGYITLSTSHLTIPSTVALTFLVRDLPSSSPRGSAVSDLGRRISRWNHSRDISGSGSHPALCTSPVGTSPPFTIRPRNSQLIAITPQHHENPQTS